MMQERKKQRGKTRDLLEIEREEMLQRQFTLFLVV